MRSDVPDTISPPRRAGTLLCAVLVCGLLWSSSAWAEEGQDAATENAAMGALTLAKHHYKAGHFKKAAKLFLEAYQLDPKSAFLYNAARAQQRAFMLDESEQTYQRYLKLETKDDRGRSKAKLRLNEIAEVRAHVKSQRAIAVKKSPAKESTRWGAWAATVIGGLMTVGGVAFLWDAESQATALKAQLTSSGGGFSTGLSKSDYETRLSSIEDARLEGGSVLGLGAAVTGLGVYLLLRHPETGAAVTWSPRPGGGLLRASLRF